MKQYPSIKLGRGGLRSMLLRAQCAVFLASILAVHAGDAIKFSPSGDDVALPDKNVKERKVDGPVKGGSSDFRGMDDLPSAMPTTPSSSMLFNNKKLQELIDQRKNWIYMTPEMSMESVNSSFEKDKSRKETVPNLFEADGQSKKVVERYLESQERKAAARFRGNSDELDSQLTRGKAGKGFISGKVSKENSPESSAEVNNAGAENPMIRPTLDINRPGFGPKSRGGQDYATQVRMDSDQRFQQLLRPTTGNPAEDPMRMLSDGTSQELQPVTGKSLESIAGEKTKSTMDPFGDPNQGAFPRGFGKINSTVMGSSSLSPAIIAPIPGSALMAQPAVLPLPRRKF